MRAYRLIIAFYWSRGVAMNRFIMLVIGLTFVALAWRFPLEAKSQEKPRRASSSIDPYWYRRLGHSNMVISATFSPNGKQVLTGSQGDGGVAVLWDTATGKEILRFGEGATRFSRDGKYVLTAGGVDNIARLRDAVTGEEVVRFQGHEGWISSALFSPDGKRVLTSSSDKTARLWDAASGKEIHRFQGSALFSPDGKQVLTTLREEKITRLWETTTGKEIHRFQGYSALVSPDGKQVVTLMEDKTARLWDVSKGKEIHRFQGHTDPITSAMFSPDGKKVLTRGQDKSARLWDAALGKEILHFQGQLDEIKATVFSPDSTKILIAGWRGAGDTYSMWLWDTTTGKEIARFRSYETMVWTAAFSPDGKQLLTAEGRTAKLWDVATAKEIVGFMGHESLTNSAVFSPDCKQVLTAGGMDNSARLWDVAGGKEIVRFQGYTDHITSATFSNQGTQLLLADRKGTVNLWDAASGKEVVRFKVQGSWVSSAVLSRDGKQLLTAGTEDVAARLWDAATGKEVVQFEGHKGLIRSAAFSPDGKFVLTRSEDRVYTVPSFQVIPDNTVRLWNAASGKEILSFRGHEGSVSSAVFSPDGQQVLTAGVDKTARLWDVDSGKEIYRLLGHVELVWRASFALDGKRVVTIGEDTRLWDAASGKQLARLQGHTEKVFSAMFSPDGKQILTGSHDKTARLWDAASGKEIRCFQGHLSQLRSAVFSPDGKLVLTAGGYDMTARLWDAVSGKEIRRLQGHTGNVDSAAFSPDGKRVLTMSRYDNTAQLWEAATGEELCKIFSFRDGSWAVVDPAGRFDASNGGDIEGLHWVVGLEPIALKQLKERFYDPGLLAKCMGFNKESLRGVKAFEDVKLFPAVAIEPLRKQDTKLILNLANRGGGIGKIQVFVNGRELLADARGPKFDADAATATMSVDLAGAIVLPGEKNKVRIVTWNAEGYLSSRGLDLDWEPPGRKDAQKMELHAIVVGVSTYDSDALKLRFAAKDAADVAKALELGGKRLFGADKTHVTLLCDGATAPTRENLEKAFEAARKCRPNDVLVVYLAGHGLALQEKDQEVYCYLTKDARTVNQDAFRDPDLRRKYSLTSTELTEWFKKIPALKQVLILDTCAAGAAAKKLIEHRDVSADQIRAIDRLRDRTGFHVLMGCASDRVSYEASQYSQGLLTYSLLQGMRGRETPRR